MRVFVFLCCVFLVASNSLLAPEDDGNITKHVGDTPDGELIDLMNEFIDMMTNIDQQWSQLMTDTLHQITDMSGHIVTTEDKILDEAEQIGVMADRIVKVEGMLSSMMKTCLHCSAQSVSMPREAIASHDVNELDHLHQDSESNVDLKAFSLLAKDLFAVDAAPPTDLGDTPLSPVIALLQYTMHEMEMMSGNVTDKILFMEQQIGVMADRIVYTEGLIMDMSGQIGIMGDRIDDVTYSMTNTSAACCDSMPKIAALPVWVPRSSLSAKPFFAKALPAQPISFQKFVRDVGECSDLDPMCVAAKALMKIMEKCEDVMFGMMNQMLNLTAKGALEIGNLADEILKCEGDIGNMSLLIGKMSDQLTSASEQIIHFGGQFCGADYNLKSTSSNQVTDTMSTVRRTVKRVSLTSDRLVQLASTSRALRAHYAEMESRMHSLLSTSLSVKVSPANGGWLDLMNRCMKAMVSMASNMVKNMDDIMKATASMGDDCVTTIGDIGKMSKQIVVMAGRMQQTADMVMELTNDCKA
jgi:methyl-accepting chemotaxis protein